MRRIFPHILWLTGLVLTIVGFVVGPGVPYQDPTPEMRLLEEKQSERLVILALIGLALVVGGVVWITARWIRRRLSRKMVT
jgi:hypothetical protein